MKYCDLSSLRLEWARNGHGSGNSQIGYDVKNCDFRRRGLNGLNGHE